MNKLIYIICLILISSILSASKNAGYGGSFVRMGLSARSIALGNTGVAGPVNAYSTFYNPALYGTIENSTVAFSYRFLSLDRRFSYIGVSMKVPPGAGFSLGWIQAGDDDLHSINSNGTVTGDINNSLHAFYFSFGRSFTERFSAGVSIKILLMYLNDGTEAYDYSAKGVGFDLGILYKIRDDLFAGYQIKDLKSKLKANTSNIFEQAGTTIDSFLVVHKLGVFYKTALPWLRVAYDFECSELNVYRHHLGLEAISGKNITFRIGYNYHEEAAVLTFGAGMDFQFLRKFDTFIDYSFLPSVANDEGSSHIFSWQIMF